MEKQQERQFGKGDVVYFRGEDGKWMEGQIADLALLVSGDEAKYWVAVKGASKGLLLAETELVKK